MSRYDNVKRQQEGDRSFSLISEKQVKASNINTILPSEILFASFLYQQLIYETASEISLRIVIF